MKRSARVQMHSSFTASILAGPPWCPDTASAARSAAHSHASSCRLRGSSISYRPVTLTACCRYIPRSSDLLLHPLLHLRCSRYASPFPVAAAPSGRSPTLAVSPHALLFLQYRVGASSSYRVPPRILSDEVQHLGVEQTVQDAPAVSRSGFVLTQFIAQYYNLSGNVKGWAAAFAVVTRHFAGRPRDAAVLCFGEYTYPSRNTQERPFVFGILS